MPESRLLTSVSVIGWCLVAVLAGLVLAGLGASIWRWRKGHPILGKIDWLRLVESLSLALLMGLFVLLDAYLNQPLWITLPAGAAFMTALMFPSMWLQMRRQASLQQTTAQPNPDAALGPGGRRHPPA